MKPKNFTKHMEEIIFADIFTDINRFMQVNKTNFLSTSLQLKLGLSLVLTQDDTIEPATNQLDMLNDSFHVTMHCDESVSNLVFHFSYRDKSHLTRLYKAAEKHSYFFAFNYIKQILSTVGKTNTDAQRVIALRHFAAKRNANYAIDCAHDIYTSASVLKMIESVDPLAHKNLSSMFSTNYPTSSLTKLYDLIAANLDGVSITRISKSAKKINILSSYINVVDQIGSQKSEQNSNVSSHGKVDIYVANLAESLNTTIGSNCRGTDVGDLFNNAFNSIKTDVKWFNKIKKRFLRDVKEKTDDSFSSWQGLCNQKRHLYHSPVYHNESNKIKLIISVDNSGSMSDSDLAKILYLFEQKSKHISEATILIHDAAVVKVITLTDDYGSLMEHPDWSIAFNRRTNGGTSHADVFRHIDKMKLTNPEEIIYCSFSDNLSDIEQSIQVFPIMRKLTTYWVRPSNGIDMNTSIVGGTNIVLP